MGGFLKKLPEASSCPKRPMPTGSRTDMLLVKAEPIRGRQCLWDDIVKKHTRSSSQTRGVRIFKTNSPADIKVSEGGEGGAPGARAEIPLQHLFDNK